MGFHHPVAFWARLRGKCRENHSQGFRGFARHLGRLVARHYRVPRPSYYWYDPSDLSSHPWEEEGVELDTEDENETMDIRAAAVISTLACVGQGYMLLEVMVIVLSAGIAFATFRLMDNVTRLRTSSSSRQGGGGRYPKDVLASSVLLVLVSLPMGLLASILTASCSWFVFSFLDHALELR